MKLYDLLYFDKGMILMSDVIKVQSIYGVVVICIWIYFNKKVQTDIIKLFRFISYVLQEYCEQVMIIDNCKRGY